MSASQKGLEGDLLGARRPVSGSSPDGPEIVDKSWCGGVELVGRQGGGADKRELAVVTKLRVT
jgi:hypothetical protein